MQPQQLQRVPPPPHTNPAPPANFPPPYRSPPNVANGVNGSSMSAGPPGNGGPSPFNSKLNVSDASIGYRHTLNAESGQQMQNSIKGMMLMQGNKNQTLDSTGQSLALQQLRNGQQPNPQVEHLQTLQSRLPLPGDTYVSPDNLRDAATRMFSRNQQDRASFGQQQQYPPGAGPPPEAYYQNGAASRSVRDTINSRMQHAKQQQQVDDSTKRNSYANHSFKQATDGGTTNGKHPPPMVPPKPQSRSTSRERLGEEVDNLDAELKHILRSEGIMQRMSLGGSSTPPLPALSPGPIASHELKQQQQQQQHRPDLLNTTRPTPTSTKQSKRQHHSQSKAKVAAVAANSNNAIGALSLDLESVLGLQTQTDLTSDESTTVDVGEAAAIRKQLDGLEGMYSEVLKLLGVRKYGRSPYGHGDKRTNRKMYGSMSSLPSVSSIGSRHIYKDSKSNKMSSSRPKERSYNKRFQRLESHVVTLARSVAHLSSEMRSHTSLQQEVEALRHDLQQMRGGGAGGAGRGYVDPENFFAHAQNNGGLGPQHRVRVKSLQEKRVEKLKSFFGDEPPLLRLFLKNLGYEKYASGFEEAKVGLLELPCLSEEKLEQLGVPMGPRNRILQEAKACIGGPLAEQKQQLQNHQQNNPNYSFYIL